jgi:hypothetical protein
MEIILKPHQIAYEASIVSKQFCHNFAIKPVEVVKYRENQPCRKWLNCL